MPLCTYYYDTGEQLITPALYVENCGAYAITETEISQDIQIYPAAISLQPGETGVSMLSPDTQAATTRHGYKHTTNYHIMLGVSDHV